jgi:hypothetical protein
MKVSKPFFIPAREIAVSLERIVAHDNAVTFSLEELLAVWNLAGVERAAGWTNEGDGIAGLQSTRLDNHERFSTFLVQNE